MKMRLPLALMFVALLAALSAGAESVRSDLTDPIPEKIQPGSIVVGVEEFMRLPRTQDSSNNMTNAAHARIQYLVPLGDAAGRLMVNDTRGVLYLTDHTGTAPVVYLDLREQDVGFDDSQFPNEMGVASVAFHPQFAAAGQPGFGKFYTAYSAVTDADKGGYLKTDAASHESVIREWSVSDHRHHRLQPCRCTRLAGLWGAVYSPR
jgi:hypothetical protein